MIVSSTMFAGASDHPDSNRAAAITVYATNAAHETTTRAERTTATLRPIADTFPIEAATERRQRA